MGADLSLEDHDLGEEAGESDSDPALEPPDPASGDEFDVTSPDVRHPSTLGLSFCALMPPGARVVLQLPRTRHFPWQSEGDKPFGVNGRYEACTRVIVAENGALQELPMWRRVPACPDDTAVVFSREEITPGKASRRSIALDQGNPLTLTVELYARKLDEAGDRLLLTVVLRNRSRTTTATEARTATLFQSYFEVRVEGGRIERYPETQRSFEQLDPEEQSMLLLYRESSTWAIGHGCAAAWDAAPGEVPSFIYADVLPAVETPSMTPDVLDESGEPIRLSMRDLAVLSDDATGTTWMALDALAGEYASWIERRHQDTTSMSAQMKNVSERHSA